MLIFFFSKTRHLIRKWGKKVSFNMEMSLKLVTYECELVEENFGSNIKMLALRSLGFFIEKFYSNRNRFNIFFENIYVK